MNKVKTLKTDNVTDTHTVQVSVDKYFNIKPTTVVPEVMSNFFCM